MRCRSLSSRAGFTLVELLVVISIIALLMSILLPSLQRARETARAVACSSNMKQMLTANQMYADSRDGWHVPVDMKPAGLPERVWAWNSGFRSAMGVPDLSESDLDHGDGDLHGGYPAGMGCPEAPDQVSVINGNRPPGDVIHTYGNNFTLGLSTGGDMSDKKYFVQSDGSYAYQRIAIEFPVKKINFVDANAWWVNAGHANHRKNWDVYGDTRHQKLVAYRHSGGINAGYFDGHVTHHSKEKVGQGSLSSLRDIWSIAY